MPFTMMTFQADAIGPEGSLEVFLETHFDATPNGDGGECYVSIRPEAGIDGSRMTVRVAQLDAFVTGLQGAIAEARRRGFLLPAGKA